jgi:mannose-6-phosphate isomerase-like protein (cupin superfamily)
MRDRLTPIAARTRLFAERTRTVSAPIIRGGKMARAMLKVSAALVVFSATAAAQTDTPATYIPKAEIQSSTAQVQLKDGGITLRTVDVGNAHVGIALRHRPKAQPDGPVIHLKVSEIYIVTAGSATLATGGVMTDQKPMSGGGEGVGPGMRGTVAKPDSVQPIKEGDIIIIPKGIPHWFTEVTEDLTYMVVRVDPEKAMALK